MHAGQLEQAVTHRRVLSLAIPMMLSQVTTPLLGFVGATAIGRLGNPALLGAMALGAIIFDFLFWTFGSLRMATAGLTAQAIGAGNNVEADRGLARALVLAGVVGFLLILLQGPIRHLAFQLAGSSPAVLSALAIYFRIRILAAPFSLANYAILGSVLGRGRTDLGLALQVAINLCNMALTVLFVLILRLEVSGAAWATLIAEVLGVGFGLIVLARLQCFPWRCGLRQVLDSAAMLRMLAVNRDVMIRTFTLMLAFGLFTGLGARAGDMTLAGNAVLENMFGIGGFCLDGFATAGETLCGQAIGAGQERQFRRAVLLCTTWCLGCGALISGLFWLGGNDFVAVMTTSSDVRAFAAGFIPYAALSPFIGAAAFAFDGIYVGATWTAAMRNLMLAAFGLFALVLWQAQALGNTGLWLSLLVFLAARGLGQALLYPRLLRHSFASSRQVFGKRRSLAGSS